MTSVVWYSLILDVWFNQIVVIVLLLLNMACAIGPWLLVRDISRRGPMFWTVLTSIDLLILCQWLLLHDLGRTLLGSRILVVLNWLIIPAIAISFLVAIIVCISIESVSGIDWLGLPGPIGAFRISVPIAWWCSLLRFLGATLFRELIVCTCIRVLQPSSRPHLALWIISDFLFWTIFARNLRSTC